MRFLQWATDHSLINLDDLLVSDTCRRPQLYITINIPESKVHGANMGPTWVLSAPDGPHIGPMNLAHDDVIKWKHFPRYWHFVLGIHRSPVNSPHKGQWRGALMFSLICAWWFETPSHSLWRDCNVWGTVSSFSGHSGMAWWRLCHDIEALSASLTLCGGFIMVDSPDKGPVMGNFNISCLIRLAWGAMTRMYRNCIIILPSNDYESL